VDAVFLESGTLVDHVRSRRAKGAGPMTVSNDLTWIGVVLRAAKSVKGIPVHPEVVEEARNACRELRLIGKSRRRERRPTAQELTKLDEYFARRDGRSRVPMRDIMWFAIHSARREAEICRLEWADNQRGRTGSCVTPNIRGARKVIIAALSLRSKPGRSWSAETRRGSRIRPAATGLVAQHGAATELLAASRADTSTIRTRS
jgi:integrase